MVEIFEKYKINLNETAEKKLERFYELLCEYNEKFNLTAITEKNEVYVKHYLDSLLGEKYLEGNTVIDIGAGGGFPSIPLKIVNPEKNFYLLDATEKKCSFLSNVFNLLELDGVEVINGRAEEYGQNKKYREKFDVCVSRAVARLNILCEYCLPFVKTGGVFIAYKGDAEEEIKEAENAVKELGGKIESIEVLDLEGAKRTFVVIRKISETPIKYPRANGRIRKKPL